MVGVEPEESDEGLDEGEVATVPTEVIMPGVVWLSGSVIVTLSPTFTSDCCVASRLILTWRLVEVAARTVAPACAGPPSVAAEECK